MFSVKADMDYIRDDICFCNHRIYSGKEWVLIIETSIALAVAAFPEGLPIVATVALAYGMLLMAKRNVIVKNYRL